MQIKDTYHLKMLKSMHRHKLIQSPAEERYIDDDDEEHAMLLECQSWEHRDTLEPEIAKLNKVLVPANVQVET